MTLITVQVLIVDQKPSVPNIEPSALYLVKPPNSEVGRMYKANKAGTAIIPFFDIDVLSDTLTAINNETDPESAFTLTTPLKSFIDKHLEERFVKGSFSPEAIGATYETFIVEDVRVQVGDSVVITPGQELTPYTTITTSIPEDGVIHVYISCSSGSVDITGVWDYLLVKG